MVGNFAALNIKQNYFIPIDTLWCKNQMKIRAIENLTLWAPLSFEDLDVFYGGLVSCFGDPS
jgi:hypothetical protein